jgi:hypothetical protein
MEITQNDVIKVWIISIDKDPSLQYTASSFEQVLNYIDGAIHPYLGDEGTDRILKDVECNKDRPFLPILIDDDRDNSHTIDVLRVDLDNNSEIVKMFCCVLNTIDPIQYPDLVVDILDLFDGAD